MRIILDQSPDDKHEGRSGTLSRLKSLKAWLARRERERATLATRDIVSSLYPRRRPPSEDGPLDPTSP